MGAAKDFLEALRICAECAGVDGGTTASITSAGKKRKYAVYPDIESATRACVTTVKRAGQSKSGSRKELSSVQYCYRTAHGDVAGYVIRVNFVDHNGRADKELRPITRYENGWRIGGAMNVLYRLPDVAQAKTVIVVEGEKACDSLRESLRADGDTEFAVVTSEGGCERAGKADWSPLSGKEIFIWPDADGPGDKYARSVATSLFPIASSVKIIAASGLPASGDAHDWLHGWVGPDGAHRQLFDKAATPDVVGIAFEHLMETATPWTGREVVTQGDSPADWPDFVPFDSRDVPPFPTAALPSVLRDWVTATSVATQVPEDLPALLALAVCGSCIARRVEVMPRRGWREPVNLFVCVALEPGNRKSAVFRGAVKPLREIEAELMEQAKPAVARSESVHRQDKARLQKLEKKAAGSTGDAADEARHQAQELAVKIALESEVVPPRLMVDDATSEKLGMMLESQGGRLASLSPEGGVFDLMAGLYSKSGIAQFTAYLTGHAGDDMIVDRVSRPSVRVERPALTCGYAVQPNVIEGLGNNVAFRGRGLVARFLYGIPLSWVGSREIAPPPVSDAIRERYHALVRQLAETDGEHVLELAPDAAAQFMEWERHVESMLGDNGEMARIKDWGAKLCGATLRIAGILHCVAHGTGGQVGGDAIAAAVSIATYLIPHAELAISLMEATEDERLVQNCKYILKWIISHQKMRFSRREAQQAGKRRFPKASDIDPPLTELVARGYIRREPEDPSGRGRPPSPVYEVNPIVFEVATAPKRPQFGQQAVDVPNSENIEHASGGVDLKFVPPDLPSPNSEKLENTYETSNTPKRVEMTL